MNDNAAMPWEDYDPPTNVGNSPPWLATCVNVPDPINHPPHYTAGKLEVIDAIEGLGLTDDHYLATAVKYIARCRHKGRTEEDLHKAIWYLQRKITTLP